MPHLRSNKMIDDIETYYAQELGKISRPFSPQLKARRWTDPIREYYRSRIAKLEAILYPVVGVDISSWQGAINWDVLATKIYFVFIRAGRGNQDRDTSYSSYLKSAHDKGRGIGIYWYMKINTGTNWKNHLDTIVPIYKDSDSQLPPVFDVEETALSKTETTGWLQKAVMNFEDRAGVPAMIYTSAGFWNNNTYRNDWAKQLKLWTAHWTTADAPLIPNDWGAVANPRTWTFWQYSNKGVGNNYGVSSTSIDLDRYQYSLAAFNTQFKMSLTPLEPVPPPPPPPPPLTDHEMVIAMWNYGKTQGWWGM